MKNRIWAAVAAVTLGTGLALAVSAPALAVNNFILEWNVPLHDSGNDYFACVHGQSYQTGVSSAVSYTNNCDVRVWVYSSAGSAAQCISPNSSQGVNFSWVGRVWISENPDNC
jgi:hypothetical protein